MQQGNIVLGLLAPADQDAAETVHPTVRPLYHPTPRLGTRLPLHLLRLVLFRRDMGCEAELVRDVLHLVIGVAQVQAQPLRLVGRWLGPFHGDALDRVTHHLHVRPVGAVHGQSDGDALGLDQQAAFGPLFGAAGYSPTGYTGQAPSYWYER